MLCSEGHMENCVLVSCAPLYHHRDVQPQGSVWPTACNQCMSTTRQGTCDASHWPSCHRWTAAYMLLQERSSLTLFIWVQGLLAALERPKANASQQSNETHLKTSQHSLYSRWFHLHELCASPQTTSNVSRIYEIKKILLGTAVRNMRSSN